MSEQVYGDDAAREALALAVGRDWREAQLSPLDAALAAYAEKLTRAPATVTESDLAALRKFGLDDVALHDAVQVVAYFNYINRIADALHVALDPGMAPYPVH